MGSLYADGARPNIWILIRQPAENNLLPGNPLPICHSGGGGQGVRPCREVCPASLPTQTDRSGLGGRERGSLTLPGSLSSLGFTLREFNCHLTP